MTAEPNVDRRILVVEDEPDLRELLTYNLTAAGFTVQATENGTDGLEAVQRFAPDVVLLDLMLPDIPGTEVCRRIRGDTAARQPAVMMLTAKGEEIDRVVGFELGADDYVVKPFSVEELLARVHAVLRRSAPDEAREGVLRVADLELDENSHEVTRAGHEIHLTATEFELLRYLMRNERMVLSKAQILDRVWKYDFQGQSNIVELYIGYLRKKVDAVEPKLIHTVRGAGYVIKAPRA
jgi:two-component system OmpR family response regulator